jgi:hypothetical protein
LPLLEQALRECVGRQRILQTVHLACAEAALRAKLYRSGAVLAEEADGEGGWLIQVAMAPRDWDAMAKQAQSPLAAAIDKAGVSEEPCS